MAKYDETFKLSVVQSYELGERGFKALAKQYGLDHAMVRRWVQSWRCGFREFGAVFKEFVTSYHVRQEDKSRRKVLVDAKAQVAILLPKAKSLLPDIEMYAKKTRQLAELIERDPDIHQKVRNIAARRGS